MKAVILAAGKGARMGDLTLNTPKPMLQIRGKNLLEYKIEALPSVVDEVILVIGYLGNKIRAHFGNSYDGRKITYIEAEPLGTAYALWQAAHLLTEHFILMYGDDLYAPKDLEECIKYEQSCLVAEIPGPMSGGKMIVKDDFVVDIQEGIYKEGGLISAGAFLFSPVIFKYPMQKIPGREEYGLPPTVVQAIHEMPMKIIHATHWKQISTPQDLELSDEELAKFICKKTALLL